jgi:hypothetical protein
MLKPLRQQEQVNVDYICPYTQEAGGILCYGSGSGMYFAEYSFTASGVRPIGIQLNNVEHVNFSRQFNPQYLRTTEVPCGIVGIGTQGDFVTDWIHIIGNVFTGDPAYVGPSGLFTNSNSFGGQRVGKFLSSLTPDPHLVTMRGLGFSREYIDPITKQIVLENNPADRLLVQSDGIIKIRITGSTL